MSTRWTKNYNDLLRQVGSLISTEKDPYRKVMLQRLYGDMKDTKIDIEVAIEDLSQMYLRNGSFPGDMVGWADDDLLEDDDDDDETKDDA